MDRTIVVALLGLLAIGCMQAPDGSAWLGARHCMDPDWAFLCEQRQASWRR